MKWTPDLAVGVEMIDEQHKELFERIDALVESVKKHECKLTIGGTLQFLEDYVIKHFSEEERLMVSIDYPGYDSHKAQHSAFMRDFESFKETIANEPSSYTRSVYTNQIVVDWITTHIKQVDRALGAYIHSRAK